MTQADRPVGRINSWITRANPDGEYRFSLEAGVVDLDVVLRGATDAGARELIDARLGPFVPARGNGRAVQCDWTVTGSDWQPLGIAEGSIDPCGLRLSPSSWYVEWRCFRIYYGRDRSDGLITDQETALVNALRGAMIWASMPGEALYFHGATLVYRDQAILLVGRPNAGKSTIGREGRADSVLCDEISILQRRPDGWWALPSPFWGSQGGTRMAEPARLGAIAVLGQDSERNRWEPLHGRHVLPSLMPHLACQASAHFEDPRLLGTVGELANGLPVFSFEWHRASHPSRRMPMDPIVRGSADGVES